MEKPKEITLGRLKQLSETQPKGLIVSISKDVPTLINVGDEVIEIYEANLYKGRTAIQIKASKAIGITGAHLLGKCYFEREKLIGELKELQAKYDYLIEQRMNQRAGQKLIQ